jgi:hypothetical protein
VGKTSWGLTAYATAGWSARPVANVRPDQPKINPPKANTTNAKYPFLDIILRESGKWKEKVCGVNYERVLKFRQDGKVSMFQKQLSHYNYPSYPKLRGEK